MCLMAAVSRCLPARERAMALAAWPEEPALPGANGTSQLLAAEDPGKVGKE